MIDNKKKIRGDGNKSFHQRKIMVKIKGTLENFNENRSLPKYRGYIPPLEEVNVSNLRFGFNNNLFNSIPM